LSDYSKVPLGQQENFVVGLLNGLGLDTSGIKCLRPRGIQKLEPAELPESRNTLPVNGVGSHRTVLLILALVLLVAGALEFLFFLQK